jgi:hypothetical protein
VGDHLSIMFHELLLHDALESTALCEILTNITIFYLFLHCDV